MRAGDGARAPSRLRPRGRPRALPLRPPPGRRAHDRRGRGRKIRGARLVAALALVAEPRLTRALQARRTPNVPIAFATSVPAPVTTSPSATATAFRRLTTRARQRSSCSRENVTYVTF